MADVTLLATDSGQFSTGTVTRTYTLPALPAGTMILASAWAFAAMLRLSFPGYSTSHAGVASDTASLSFSRHSDGFWYAKASTSLAAGHVVTVTINSSGFGDNTTWHYTLFRLDNCDTGATGSFSGSSPYTSGSDLVVPYTAFTSTLPATQAIVFQGILFQGNQGASSMSDTPDGSWTWEAAFGVAGDGTPYLYHAPSDTCYADQHFRVGWQIIPALGTTDGTDDRAPEVPGAGPTLGGLADGVALRYFGAIDTDLTGDFSNLHNRWPYYWRAGGATGGNVAVHRAEYPVPASYTSRVIAAAGTQPCLGYEDRRSRLWVIFTSSGGGVKDAYSDDDGATWSTPAVAFTTGTRPVIAVCPQTGFILRAVFDDPNIVGTITEPDGTVSDHFTFQDDTATDLEFEDERFDLSYAYNGRRSILLAAKKLGDTVVTDFESVDDGRTWLEL